MAPAHGMTCQPGLSDGEGGTSYDIENASVFQTGHHIHPDAYNPEGYVNEANGEVEYANDDGFEPEGMPISDADNQIMEGLMELFPDYSQALKWATSTKPAHIAQQYNQALDNNDWSTVTPMLEQFIQEYRDYRQNPTMDEQVRQEVEDMGFEYPDDSGEEPDEYSVETYEEMARQMANQGDDIASDVLECMAMLNSGEITQEAFYQALLEHYEMDELMGAFERIPDFAE